MKGNFKVSKQQIDAAEQKRMRSLAESKTEKQTRKKTDRSNQSLMLNHNCRRDARMYIRTSHALQFYLQLFPAVTIINVKKLVSLFII
jgi:hypothetical protein